MSGDLAYSTIRDFLTANWTACPLVWENEVSNASDEQAFMYVELIENDDYEASIGTGSPTTNLWREEGSLILYISVPSGQGSLLARQLGNQMKDLLRGLELPGVLRFHSMSLGSGRAGSEDGMVWEITLRADYTKS